MRRATVLFVCTHNSARSQMAEGLLRALRDEDYQACSAGTVATRVKPEAIQVMLEAGIDIRGQRSETIDQYDPKDIDYVVTVCDDAAEACPYFPARRGRVHRPFRDPSDVVESQEARLQAFRDARDEIRAWIEATFRETEPNF